MPIHRNINAQLMKAGDLSTSFKPMITVDFTCYQCLQTTRVIPDTVVDAECDMWRTRYEKVQALITEQIKKFNAKHGTDPFEVEWLELMHQLRELMGDK